MKLWIVIPIFNEQEVLPELFRRVGDACGRLTDVDWRVLLVNDGSGDRTPQLIREHCAADPRWAMLDLSRNFGHQPAISAGLAEVGDDADAVMIMDGDMQDPPELVADFVDAWRRGGQVVLAVRRSRAEKGVRRALFEAFYKVFGMLSDFPVTPQSGVFGLLDACAVRELNRLPEKNRFLPGLRSWIGFEQRTVFYERAERAAGAPKQNFGRLLRYGFDAIVSFSYKPLRLMTIFGALVALAGFALAALFIYKRLAGVEQSQMGFTTIISVVLIMGGLQLLALGLVAQYIGRIYDEVKRRPLYIVKARVGLQTATGKMTGGPDGVESDHGR